jgi:hypothetical protein
MIIEMFDKHGKTVNALPDIMKGFECGFFSLFNFEFLTKNT